MKNGGWPSIFYGTSNGADFGITLGAKYPDLFDYYICISSTGGGEFEPNSWGKSNCPFYFLAYGKDEPIPLKMGTNRFRDYLKEKGFDFEFREYNGKHDKAKWEKEFFKTLPEIFEKSKD